LCNNKNLFSQEIKGSFIGVLIPLKYMYLIKQSANKETVVDSALIKNNQFVFKKNNYLKGYYWLMINDTNRMDIIINPAEKQLTIEFDNEKLIKGINIIQSNENKLLWESKRLSKTYREKINKEILFRNQLSLNDAKMQAISKANQESLEKELEHKLTEMIIQNANSFFSESTLKYKELNTIYQNKEKGRSILIRQLPFNQKEYLNTTLYQQAILNIFKNHTAFNEDGFKQTVDSLLIAAKPYQEEYALFLELLTDIFYQIGPEAVLSYIIENYYLQDGCSGISSSQYVDLIKQYASIQIGNVCPDFNLINNADTITLYQLISKNKNTPIVLFFYSSHCGFCHQTIADLKNNPQLLQNNKFIFISLDAYKKDWEDFKENLPNNVLNYCDFKGWESEPIKKIKINKTPTLIRLSSAGIILFKGGNLKW